ncbi:MAG: hypothetical protein EOO12_04855 [Chitinophagaceae bacterium]|nr:MAG: hypothetical protein EOO12_04855 [Chitinophagaceae bacterium]
MKYRSLCTLLGASLFALTTYAQPNIPGNSVFRADIQKVVADFPHDFSTLRGRTIDRSPQSVEYASSVKPEGATESSITEYSSGGKAIFSWQTVLLRTEDFDAAAKKYKWAFGQLKGMNVRYVVDQYTLEGRYDAPDEGRSFATSDLSVARPPEKLQKLRVRVQLQLEDNEWKVSLSVFEKEREDDEMASSD